MTDTTRESVERFGPYAVDGGCDAYGQMEADDFGDWVRFEDYTALLARAEAAETERDALAAKLAVAVDGLKASEAEIDAYILDEYPFGHPSLDRYRQRDYDSNPARIALAQLTADTPNGADEDNRRAEMEEAQHQEEMRRMEEREMEDHFRRHPHG